MQSKRYNFISVVIALCAIAAFTVPDISAQTLTIEECRQMAVSGSARTKNAELDRLSAGERRKEALWAYFPTVSITGGTFYAFNPMLEITLKDVLGNSDMANNLISSIESSAHSYGIEPIFRSLSRGTVAMMTVSQPLFVGGRIVNSNRLAKIGYESSELKQNIAKREICEEVEAGYWQTVSLEQKKITLEQAIAMAENICGTVEAAVEAGLATSADLMQVKQQLSMLKSDLTRLDSGILLAKMSLCNLIGQDYVVLKALASDDKPYVADIGFLSTLEGLQPPDGFYKDENEICNAMEEMQLLALSEKAEKLQKRIAVGETLPQISVGASCGYNDILNHQSVNGMVYAMVKIPLTDWGRNAHNVRRHAYDVKKAVNDREYLSGQLLLGVRKLWMDAVSAWQQVDSDEQMVNTAQARLEAVKADHNAGMATLSDLLQAQNTLLQCNNSLTDSKIAYVIAIRKYLNLTTNPE